MFRIVLVTMWLIFSGCCEVYHQVSFLSPGNQNVAPVEQRTVSSAPNLGVTQGNLKQDSETNQAPKQSDVNKTVDTRNDKK